MVDIDKGADGVVTLRFVPPYGEADEQAYLAALAMIGAMAEPFALLAVLGGAGALSPAGERAQALWFKATRARMNAACRGLAIVRPGAGPAMAETFGRLWSFPVTLEPDEAAARAVLLSRLGRAA